MALPIIYSNGKIQDLETAKMTDLVAKPKPGLFTSSSSPWGALVLGIFLLVVGANFVYHLIVDPGNEWPPLYVVVLILGLSCLPTGFIIGWKAIAAFHNVAHPIKFFFYDDARIVMGVTKDVDRISAKRIRSKPKTEQISELIALSAGHTIIPVNAVEYIEIGFDKIQGRIGNMKIKSSAAEIMVDISELRLTLGLSRKGDQAFNSISQYYTQATGTTIKASIKNV
jgi:hypothetical protein